MPRPPRRAAAAWAAWAASKALASSTKLQGRGLGRALFVCVVPAKAGTHDHRTLPRNAQSVIIGPRLRGDDSLPRVIALTFRKTGARDAASIGAVEKRHRP